MIKYLYPKKKKKKKKLNTIVLIPNVITGLFELRANQPL